MSRFHPAFIIVPGAWHPPECYSDLITTLQEAGYSAIAINLPSLDTKSPETTSCSLDAEVIRAQILLLTDDQRKDVVVVCHSYGGIPGGGAAHGLSKHTRYREGKEGGVVGLVYLAAFVLPEGPGLYIVNGRKHFSLVIENQPSPNQCTVRDPKDAFFHDVPDLKASHLVQLLRPQSMYSLDSPVSPQAWAELDFRGRLGYVRCLQDQALPLSLQDTFMQKSGVEWKVKDIESSHSPFASKPRELAEILVQLAREFET